MSLVSMLWGGSEMRSLGRGLLYFLLLASANAILGEARAQNVTASVSGQVTSGTGAGVKSGGQIRDGETVKTGSGSSASLMLKDKTAFTVGADATVKVSGTSGGTGGTGFEVKKGGFRLISGAQDPSTYKINTPQATLGVRGTIVEGYVDTDLGIEIIVLVDGAFTTRTAQGTVTVDKPGNYVVISSDGRVSPPAAWPGELLSLNASLNLSQAYLAIVEQHGADVLPRYNDFNAAFKARTYGARFPTPPAPGKPAPPPPGETCKGGPGGGRPGEGGHDHGAHDHGGRHNGGHAGDHHGGHHDRGRDHVSHDGNGTANGGLGPKGHTAGKGPGGDKGDHGPMQHSAKAAGISSATCERGCSND